MVEVSTNGGEKRHWLTVMISIPVLDFVCVMEKSLHVTWHFNAFLN